MKKEYYLIIFLSLFYSVSCYSQYSISGYLNSKEKNKTVYLSLLKYNEENLISTNQILFSTQTDSTGYFEMKGKLLSDKNKLYRIHSNLDEKNSGLQLFDNGKNKNYHNFIFSNSDTIFFPNQNQEWFSHSQNSNKADGEWRKSLAYELELLESYNETKNMEAIQQVKKSYSKELKLYCTDSLKDPLVKLLAFSHLKNNISDLQKDYEKSPEFYSKMQNELKQQYFGASYYLQFQEELSNLSISSIKKSYQFHKKINYLLGVLALMLLTVVFVLFLKNKKQRKQVIINEVSTLTNQEEKIAKLICEGLSNKEIASTLFISSSTVKTHIRNLYSKLEISNRQQLIEKLKNHP
ncbi:response regulator transcription factor [Tenacibaculum xiamenense]|uniref:response regulator transcription factor n=1 Tax=Tenacibaculum xiamenense TaxID=1261553 RepID=UPI003894B1B8